MLRAFKLVCAIALIFAIGIGCDSADNPTAPQMPPPPPVQTAVTITANPSEVMPGEDSVLTVSVTRSDGSSTEGEMVTLDADVGTLSATTLTLDAMGEASATFTAPSEDGVATVTASLGTSTASVGIEVIDRRVAVSPEEVELDHSREASRCEDPIRPLIEVTNLSTEPIGFRVVDDLPDWLTVDVFTGTVPGEFQAIFTCDVGEGDLDLSHEITVLGTDVVTAGTVGREAKVLVTVHVRP